MILGIAALISKILGGVYRIPFQNIVGNDGLALYNLVYPMYTTLLVVSTAGFPIAVSKFVSERLAMGDIRGAERVFRIAFIIMIITGLTSFSLLFFGASWLAELAGDPGAALSIKSVSFALLVVPIIAVVRGYFQGWQDMIPTAVSQVFEQLVRVITILVLSIILIRTSVELAAAGAVFGAFAGAVLSVFILAYYYWKHRKVVARRQQLLQESNINNQINNKVNKEPIGQLLKKMTIYALPICFGSLVLPLFNLADSYTISNVLQFTGMEYLDARYMFGVYSKALPLVQISALFATALSLALIPSISEAKSLNHNETIRRRTAFALRLTVIIGLPAAFGLAVLAEPLNIALYNETIGTEIIVVLAMATVFSTLEITSSGILQGLGESKAPAINLFIGVLVKIALNIVLIIYIGLIGAAIATIVAYLIALVLNMRDLKKYTNLRYEWSLLLVKPLVASIIMALCVYGVATISSSMLEATIPLRLLQAIVSAIGVFVGIIVYAIALLMTKSLTIDELDMIPKVGSRLKRIVLRLGLYKH